MPQALRAFFSYAHEDDRFRIRLEKSLRLLERQGLIESWHDRKLLPGDDWAREIDSRLERSELILFLISPDFIDSDYCWGVEMTRALARREAGEALVVPLVVRPVGDWEAAPFGRLQALLGGKAVTSWDDEDAAWAEVARELRRLVESFQPGGAAAAVPAGGPADPIRYLEALELEHSFVEIRGMGAQVAEQMPLDQVYTRLRVGPTAGGAPDRAEKALRRGGEAGDFLERGGRDLELSDVLREHRHAVLVGDPGSGKTTFLRFAAQVLARARLQDRPNLAAEHLGLTGEPPFPVFVPLNRLAEHLADPAHADATCPPDAPEHFLRYLDFTLRGHSFGLPEGYLRRRVETGGCLLLLDGLDEVPGALRPRVARIVERVVIESAKTNRHLLTCRTRAYEGTTQLAALPSFRLAPFNPAQVARFVEAWSRALLRVPAVDPGEEVLRRAEDYRRELQAQINAHPNIGPLTESPLMLTMLAVVHWSRKRMPEQRVELYEAAVDYLLESRREQSPFPATLRREALQALALRMFEDAEGVQRSLGRREAAAAAAPALDVTLDEAEAYLEGESLHSGLLVSRTDGEVEFWHLTFQEYLAAVDLAWSEDAWSALAPHLFDDRWAEVVLLFAGWLRWRHGQRPVKRLIERVLATGSDLPGRARAVGLLGRVLRDVRPFGGDPAAGTGYEATLAETLALFTPGGPEIEERLRVEVGEALGQAGDPRLGEDNRVALPGGAFLMGAQKSDPLASGYDKQAYDDESPVHRVTVSPFAISRYPVTVAEFRRFVEAGERGYLAPRLWAHEGWAWRENEGIAAPGSWEQQLAHPNRPVVEVSWYEADAYSRWVGGRLPTEAEWEYAARGAEGRRFPWGAEALDGRRTNFARHVGDPTPVGIYPEGASPEGVFDLVGNVWEWCHDRFAQPYPAGDLTDPQGPAKGSSRVLRGGSFNNDPPALRGSSRNRRLSGVRSDHIGFRVVWGSAPGLD